MQDERVQQRQQDRQQDRQNQGQRSNLSTNQQLRQTTWEELDEEGAYVEEGTGALYRVPAQALQGGESPVIGRVQKQEPVLFQVSTDPNITLSRARMIAANNDIQPNF